MNTRKMVAAIGLAMALGGCEGWEFSSSSYSTNDISFGDPAGVIAGAPWSMAMARVRSNGSDLDVELFAESVEPCGFDSSDKPMVTFSVPAAVETYSVDFSRRLTFVESSDMSTSADGGFIDVTSVSDTHVVIGIIADSGNEYSVNGTFMAEICP